MTKPKKMYKICVEFTAILKAKDAEEAGLLAANLVKESDDVACIAITESEER